MPDAQIIIEKVWKGDPQEGQYGTYHKYDVQYAGGGKARYVTFKDELGEKAKASEGRKVLVTFDPPKQEGHNPVLTAISDPLDATVAETPALGTGEYVKGKDAPETRAGIAASVALREAVSFCTSVGTAHGSDVLKAADDFYDWLTSKTAAAAPQNGAQGADGASATEGQIKEIAQWLVVLEKAQPASPDPNWTWADEARRYTETNFQKKSATELTKAEAEQTRAWLEVRHTEIEAGAKQPF